jgi:hypothetical protein
VELLHALKYFLISAEKIGRRNTFIGRLRMSDLEGWSRLVVESNEKEEESGEVGKIVSAEAMKWERAEARKQESTYASPQT